MKDKNELRKSFEIEINRNKLLSEKPMLHCLKGCSHGLVSRIYSNEFETQYTECFSLI